MTITVNIGDADLSELLAKVEAGEDVVLARDGVPVAQLTSVTQPISKAELIETILRERAGRKTVTQEEIAEWKQIGRR
ncbi:type II toxin-antitoxin system Phd/YefM family antitoxin [Aliirhizobium smilacinae]|uniref:Type II toxin-antitoxin system prevent-host-death family antitoxin n=1 Tax=Aliirhizobium smilacinae TaxID=1395944 RepID=A0A5C4XQ78_9HYPH|nr:type II toxin-antitoxin system prevent-host-death family antitoxin [Rhizobium smilacinae]TNM65468.1 type II toxin-antitoxin system prevent-host-death family antitoxin [Rhizobium smilacinae]